MEISILRFGVTKMNDNVRCVAENFYLPEDGRRHLCDWYPNIIDDPDSEFGFRGTTPQEVSALRCHEIAVVTFGIRGSRPAGRRCHEHADEMRKFKGHPSFKGMYERKLKGYDNGS